jgi:hypothetical protein
VHRDNALRGPTGALNYVLHIRSMYYNLQRIDVIDVSKHTLATTYTLAMSIHPLIFTGVTIVRIEHRIINIPAVSCNQY